MNIYRLLLPIEIYNEEECYISNKNKIVEIPFSSYITSEIPIDITYHRDVYNFELSNDEISNFICHRNIWKTFLKTGDPYCLIVESNVKLHISYEEIDNLCKSFPKDLDIFFPYDMPKRKEEESKKSSLLLNKNLREESLSEPYLLGYKWGNSIYFLSKKGAEKLLSMEKIRDRLDNEIMKMSLKGELNVYYEDVSWLNINDINWREWPSRIKNIWNFLIHISPWTEERKVKLKNLLSIISQLATELNIELLLQGGTHLGYIQHRGIMPWDDDVDLGIEDIHLAPFLLGLSTIKGIQFREFLELKTKETYYKVWKSDGEKIKGHTHTFPFVDIWVYKRVNKDLIFRNGIICPNSALKDFIKIIFEDSPFYIPYNSIEVLDSRYTCWKNKVVVYPLGHHQENNYFPKLVFPIQTDKTGRMLGF